MSEDRPDAAEPAAEPAASAGRLLRQARQAQGMHIAVLAAAIKVSTRKLEALEADRYDELPDATFARALAQTVCRTLKIDPAPVLALLPPPSGYRLEQVGEGINTPFRERPGQEAAGDAPLLGKPAVWAPLVVLLLAAVVYFLPSGLLTPGDAPPPEPTPAVVVVTPPAASMPEPAAAPPAPEPTASAAVDVVHSAPPPPVAQDAASAAAPAIASGLLQLRTSAESWVEVIDARGRTLLSRVLTPGEAVGVDGVVPLRVTIGNASETQVVFRGQAVDMGRVGRDNVARLELK